MLQFFLGMHLQLGGDVHIGSALQHLGIIHIRDDRLVFPGQIFIEQGDELFTGDGGFFFGHCRGINLSSFLAQFAVLSVRAAKSVFGWVQDVGKRLQPETYQRKGTRALLASERY